MDGGKERRPSSASGMHTVDLSYNPAVGAGPAPMRDFCAALSAQPMRRLALRGCGPTNSRDPDRVTTEYTFWKGSRKPKLMMKASETSRVRKVYCVSHSPTA